MLCQLLLLLFMSVTDFVLGLEKSYNLNDKLFSGLTLYYCSVISLIITELIIWYEYYTGTNYRPVKSVASSSTTGHGTNVIQGLAILLKYSNFSINYCSRNFINKSYCWTLRDCYRCYNNISISWYGCCSRYLWTSDR